MHEPTLGFRAVLYTPALEPITVLQLTPQARHHLLECGMVVLAVYEPLTVADVMTFAGAPLQSLAEHAKCRRVVIRAEEFRRGRHRSLMLFTGDEENALLLQAAFLPGQTRELNYRREDDFARGFLSAIGALGL
jgi:hypothetical protein